MQCCTVQAQAHPSRPGVLHTEKNPDYPGCVNGRMGAVCLPRAAQHFLLEDAVISTARYSSAQMSLCWHFTQGKEKTFFLCFFNKCLIKISQFGKRKWECFNMDKPCFPEKIWRLSCIGGKTWRLIKTITLLTCPNDRDEFFMWKKRSLSTL